jgi:hypothetical protein
LALAPTIEILPPTGTVRRIHPSGAAEARGICRRPDTT